MLKFQQGEHEALLALLDCHKVLRDVYAYLDAGSNFGAHLTRGECGHCKLKARIAPLLPENWRREEPDEAEDWT